MVIKMYVSGISASKEVKKKQQRALMILESIKVPFESIDITEPGKEEERDFMKEHCKQVDGVPTLPPHFFNEKDYCGDFDDFDQATEEDRLIVFLKLDPAEYNLNGSSLLPEGLEPIIMPGDKGEGEAETGMVNGSREEPAGDHVESMEIGDDSKERKEEGAVDEAGVDEKGEADEGSAQEEEEKKEDTEEKKEEDVPEAEDVASKSVEEADNAQSAEGDEAKAADDEMKPADESADEPTEEEQSGDKEDIEDDGTEKEE